MKRNLRLATICVTACLTLACSSPAGPGPLQVPQGSTGPGGSTLKVVPPIPIAPRDGQTADSLTPTLDVRNTGGFLIPGLDLELVFEVFDEKGTLVYRSAPVTPGPGNRTTHVVGVPLAAGRPHTWQANHVLGTHRGPPSARVAFRTP